MCREVTRSFHPPKRTGKYPIYGPILIKWFIELAQEFIRCGINLHFLLFKYYENLLVARNIWKNYKLSFIYWLSSLVFQAPFQQWIVTQPSRLGMVSFKENAFVPCLVQTNCADGTSLESRAHFSAIFSNQCIFSQLSLAACTIMSTCHEQCTIVLVI